MCLCVYVCVCVDMLWLINAFLFFIIYLISDIESCIVLGNAFEMQSKMLHKIEKKNEIKKKTKTFN